jgi:aconitate hydratase
MLALTFANKEDYNLVQEDDRIDVIGLTRFTPGTSLQVVLHHADGTSNTIEALHSYNQQQIEWFKAGGALNVIRSAMTR